MRSGTLTGGRRGPTKRRRREEGDRGRGTGSQAGSLYHAVESLHREIQRCAGTVRRQAQRWPSIPSGGGAALRAPASSSTPRGRPPFSTAPARPSTMVATESSRLHQSERMLTRTHAHARSPLSSTRHIVRRKSARAMLGAASQRPPRLLRASPMWKTTERLWRNVLSPGRMGKGQPANPRSLVQEGFLHASWSGLRSGASQGSERCSAAQERKGGGWERGDLRPRPELGGSLPGAGLDEKRRRRSTSISKAATAAPPTRRTTRIEQEEASPRPLPPLRPSLRPTALSDPRCGRFSFFSLLRPLTENDAPRPCDVPADCGCRAVRQRWG